MRFRANENGVSAALPRPISSCPTDRSKEIPLLQFFFVCASVISHVALAVPLFVLHYSFLWCLRTLLW